MWIRLKRRGVSLELLVRDDAVLPPPATSAGEGGVPSPSPLLSETIYTNGATGTRAGAADLARAFGGPTSRDAAVAAILATGVPRRPASAVAMVTSARAAAVLGVLIDDYVDANTGRVVQTMNYPVGMSQTKRVLLDLAAVADAVGLSVGANPRISPAVEAERLASALASRGGPCLMRGPLVAEFAWPIAATKSQTAIPLLTDRQPPSSPPQTLLWEGCPALTVARLPSVTSPPASAAIAANTAGAHTGGTWHPADFRVTLRPGDWESLLSWATARGAHCVRAIPPAEAWTRHCAGDRRRRAAVAGADDVTQGGGGKRHGPRVPFKRRGRGGRTVDRGGRHEARAREKARRADRDERRAFEALA